MDPATLLEEAHMTRALVVCPATDDLELIEFVDTPLGALLHACSRFRPPTALACGRACAGGARCDLARCEDAFEVNDEPERDDTDIDIDIDVAGGLSAS
jgi:hypothetical protein